ncbi:ROK family protein, putative [Acanthamoeba castellanii str. Neff]|uniref:fructokinase n=1 Tax=Acanthamoeba castellanii (strain ATCC 30010 / Neff) TaxID=1257118 RepID=L8GIN5_ACACF|nr:ROK family protein, putative [Acanthamoeba castellanii str. Neff]ELR12036.1 ROK family protein, putative [Acanthamoeba castellanii str. Neff]
MDATPTSELVFAGVEAGGTSFSVGLARGSAESIFARANFPTTTPDETIGRVVAWLREQNAKTPFHALGIASFGPVDLDRASPTYGYITTTPKPDWGNVDVLSRFSEFNVPTAFETDVNAPAVAHLAQFGQPSCAYITVGTGVGVGIAVEGKPVHGLLHPEMGHIFVRMAKGDDFEGTCPFHGGLRRGTRGQSCVGQAVRRGADGSVGRREEWDHVAYYLAQLCAALVLTVSPHRIVMGGGIMQRPTILPLVHKHVLALLNGYIKVPAITESGIGNYITLSPFGGNAGLVGACELARLALPTTRLLRSNAGVVQREH